MGQHNVGMMSGRVGRRRNDATSSVIQLAFDTSRNGWPARPDGRSTDQLKIMHNKSKCRRVHTYCSRLQLIGFVKTIHPNGAPRTEMRGHWPHVEGSAVSRRRAPLEMRNNNYTRRNGEFRRGRPATPTRDARGRPPTRYNSTSLNSYRT